MGAAVANKLMRVEEFLGWDSGDELRYDLIEGVPVSHAAPSPNHSRVTNGFAFELTRAIPERKPPCQVEPGSGVSPTRRSRWNYFIPDVVVKCGRSRAEADAPIIVIEVMSPSNT